MYEGTVSYHLSFFIFVTIFVQHTDVDCWKNHLIDVRILKFLSPIKNKVALYNTRNDKTGSSEFCHYQSWYSVAVQMYCNSRWLLVNELLGQWWTRWVYAWKPRDFSCLKKEWISWKCHTYAAVLHYSRIQFTN